MREDADPINPNTPQNPTTTFFSLSKNPSLFLLHLTTIFLKLINT